VAGLNVEEDLADPEIMAAIKKVLNDFEPEKGLNEEKEDEVFFEARYEIFSHQQTDAKSTIRQRRNITKTVREGYEEERQRYLENYDRLQAEKEAR
jgi:hypothetical protein